VKADHNSGSTSDQKISHRIPQPFQQTASIVSLIHWDLEALSHLVQQAAWCHRLLAANLLHSKNLTIEHMRTQAMSIA
jgi:hypothetical protein